MCVKSRETEKEWTVISGSMNRTIGPTHRIVKVKVTVKDKPGRREGFQTCGKQSTRLQGQGRS
jgi:hypothetical protein